VLVELDAVPGDQLALRTIYYDRGHNIPDTGPSDIVTIAITDEGPTPAALPEAWGEVTAIPFDAATPRRAFVLREVEEGGAEPIFTINDEAYPDITPVLGSMGGIEVWEIDNESEMDHPFHLHGMSFQVLDDAGVSIPRLGWKDTLNVPQDQTLRFVVQFGGEGRWMYHCHILEHAERGMMGELMIE
jgi:FtsP/CotA-like multicopper oxidase with cupredoxin domain